MEEGQIGRVDADPGFLVLGIEIDSSFLLSHSNPYWALGLLATS